MLSPFCEWGNGGFRDLRKVSGFTWQVTERFPDSNLSVSDSKILVLWPTQCCLPRAQTFLRVNISFSV